MEGAGELYLSKCVQRDAIFEAMMKRVGFSVEHALV